MTQNSQLHYQWYSVSTTSITRNWMDTVSTTSKSPTEIPATCGSPQKCDAAAAPNEFLRTHRGFDVRTTHQLNWCFPHQSLDVMPRPAAAPQVTQSVPIVFDTAPPSETIKSPHWFGQTIEALRCDAAGRSLSLRLGSGRPPCLTGCGLFWGLSSNLSST